MDITNECISKCKTEKQRLNHDKIANEFTNELRRNYSDDDLCKLLSCTGFIPDLYTSDSGEETLFTKLIEVLVAEWGNRMGYIANFVKEKSSYEDVNMVIDNKTLVCDAKSFRLGRSQAAPNVKDFLKLEDIRKWLSRYEHRLGGLVIYPDTHEWTKGSDAYLYCSTKDCPTVMLPYIYLALLLHFKDKFSPERIAELWQYDRLFPKALPKKSRMGNRKLYWEVINAEIMRITHLGENEFVSYINQCKAIQMECIEQNYNLIKMQKDIIVEQIKKDEAAMTEQEVREAFAEYKISTMTKSLDDFMERIKNFRLNK